MSDPPVGDYDGLGTGAEHLMQGETVEIDIRRHNDEWDVCRGARILYRGSDSISLHRLLSSFIHPGVTTIVRWHGGER